MLTELSCRDFANELASKKPVPGGGGAAAMVAALGAALNTMVANFSYGKKKFIDIKDKHEELIKRGEILRVKLIDLVDKDAEYFEPLSRAYVMPSNTEEEKALKNETLQRCLMDACSAPMETLEYSYDAILLHEEIIDISSKNIISDVGVGVQLLKAALNSAYLNVLINLNSMDDENYARRQKEKAEKLVDRGTKTADELYEKVVTILNP
ncbi:MAG: cyclodeaminase/cyclohydrolase family protein [Tissierellia bacterium]|nr:cyclodeaminase/cyclohydrolase family protein [Tissierellia bacterium]MDD3226678.1 cyclodeaminase/cyclohydrolase family protein [Tissierellia bacterium]MDD3750665.1 cyclodeaminase/cyclohydrolase family protein [Tissierellia bacterium]MDD4046389.1 cyclodeaminase/cyclohydrolase family protein [Tissierellia bacterium]MDD4678848.1 cyclodeaminase/cyclohydrolase family protein [Tissierellia bacterium]